MNTSYKLHCIITLFLLITIGILSFIVWQQQNYIQSINSNLMKIEKATKVTTNKKKHSYTLDNAENDISDIQTKLDEFDSRLSDLEDENDNMYGHIDNASIRADQAQSDTDSLKHQLNMNSHRNTYY